MLFTFPTQYADHNSIVRDFGPSRPIGEGFEANSVIFTGDSGQEQRRKKGETKLTFDISYNVVEENAWKVLKSFFMARGMVESFTWVHPVSKESLQCRFSGPLQGKNIGHNAKTALYEASCKLITVF